jgi:nitric oxide reductase NorQ protein
VSKKLQILLESGLNILLDGPQGCGKTVLAKSIAKSLGMEFVFFNCGAVVEATDFFATIQVRASETGQPVTDFIKTDVLTALEEADPEGVSSHQEPVRAHFGQRAVHRGGEPRQRVFRDLRD